MRISTTDAFGPVKNVVKIVVRAFNGDIILQQDITTVLFRNGNNSYNGNYIEDFFTNGITVSGDTSILGINRGFPTDPKAWMDTTHADTSNHVDFEIEWYGEVNVWIDYVKIMDEPAYNLFNSNPFIRNRIKGQIQKMMNHPNGGVIRGFYTEEIEYSNLTCLTYRSKLCDDLKMILIYKFVTRSYKYKTRSSCRDEMQCSSA